MKNIILALLILAAFSGCLKQDENTITCTYDACGTKAPASEIQQVRDYLTANNITATEHCSGLFYIIDNPGNGASPTVCNSIAFTYEGKLTNGTVFDSATQPVVYGLSQLITGFKNGIPLIKTGGRIRLFVPPSLGYGANPSGSIPANSILIFDVNLVGIQ